MNVASALAPVKTSPPAPVPAGRRLVAALVLAHLLAVLVLAASPRLHAWIHPDADDDDHDCAAVLFLHGGVDGAAPLPLIAAAPLVLAAVLVAAVRPAAFVPSVFARGRVFEHAPPAAA